MHFFLPALALALSSGSGHGVSHKHQAKPPLINTATEQKNDPYWQMALKEVYKSPAELAAQEERYKRRGFTPDTLRHGDRTKNQILLTFDDGPHPDYTPKLLKILKDQHVKATFFVVGKMAEQYPNLIRAIRDGGHTIGNHTFSHVTLTKIRPRDAWIEYRANNDLIESISGVRMRYCRPPGGDYNREVLRASSQVGLTTVLWTDDPGDYENPGDAILLNKTLRKIGPGGIVLLHDGSQNTLDILPAIIKAVRKKNFEFVTPDQMLNIRP